MHFGFSYTGLLFLLMLTIPNLIWTKNQNIILGIGHIGIHINHSKKISGQ